jgi:DNA-3-methyladenine glycosylase
MDLAPLFSSPIDTLARALIGATFTVRGCGGIIVETEAYGRADPASHSVNGPTARNRAMFLGPGHVYVYLSYGLHHCINLVGQPGEAVLIRALQPQIGLDAMVARRGPVPFHRLAAGPGNLARALGIGLEDNGLPLEPSFDLALPQSPVPVSTGPRIGLTKATDVLWRFGLSGSAFLSRPFPRARNNPEI